MNWDKFHNEFYRYRYYMIGSLGTLWTAQLYHNGYWWYIPYMVVIFCLLKTIRGEK